jgi:hypothetical protein
LFSIGTSTRLPACKLISPQDFAVVVVARRIADLVARAFGLERNINWCVGLVWRLCRLR